MCVSGEPGLESFPEAFVLRRALILLGKQNVEWGSLYSFASHFWPFIYRLVPEALCYGGFCPVSSSSPCRLYCCRYLPNPRQCFVHTCHSFPGPAACWAESSTAAVCSSALQSTVCSSQTQFAPNCCCVHKPALSRYYLCFNRSRI